MNLKKKKRIIATSYKLTANSLQSGFTLIELMIYMGLLSIFLFVLTDLLASTLDIRAKSTGSSAVTLESEYIRRRLEYDIHRSSSITLPVTGGNGSELRLTIAGTTYSYAVVDGILTVTSGGTSTALTNNAVSVPVFSVSRIGNGNEHDTLQVTVTLSSTTQIRGTAAETKTETFTMSKW